MLTASRFFWCWVLMYKWYVDRTEECTASEMAFCCCHAQRTLRQEHLVGKCPSFMSSSQKWCYPLVFQSYFGLKLEAPSRSTRGLPVHWVTQDMRELFLSCANGSACRGSKEPCCAGEHDPWPSWERISSSRQEQPERAFLFTFEGTKTQ